MKSNLKKKKTLQFHTHNSAFVQKEK